jgi:hypothetical protein
MPKNHLSVVVLAALIGFSACGGNQEEQARESTTASPAGDAPPAAITNPASPAPIGTDVGTVGTDATAAPPTPGDTAHQGAHP